MHGEETSVGRSRSETWKMRTGCRKLIYRISDNKFNSFSLLFSSAFDLNCVRLWNLWCALTLTELGNEVGLAFFEEFWRFSLKRKWFNDNFKRSNSSSFRSTWFFWLFKVVLNEFLLELNVVLWSSIDLIAIFKRQFEGFYQILIILELTRLCFYRNLSISDAVYSALCLYCAQSIIGSVYTGLCLYWTLYIPDSVYNRRCL
jgi:hypothetical protein